MDGRSAHADRNNLNDRSRCVTYFTFTEIHVLRSPCYPVGPLAQVTTFQSPTGTGMVTLLRFPSKCIVSLTLFQEDVEAINGWSRWVQADTLSQPNPPLGLVS